MFNRKQNVPHISDIIRSPELQRNYQFFWTMNDTANGAASDSTRFCGNVLYAAWRVVAMGFYVNNNFATTVAEGVNFGVYGSDLANSDDDYFGTFIQDVTDGKQLLAGDSLQVKKGLLNNVLVEVDPPANAGTHRILCAGNFGAWKTKQAMLSITKKNVGSSTGIVDGWYLIEIGNPNDLTLV